MQLIRKILLVLIIPLLPVFLFATAFDVGIVRVAGHPDGIKKILSDSGIYTTIVPAALDQAKQASGNNGGSVPLTNPDVQTAAKNTFTPQFVQQSTNQVIDGIYHWLDGKTAQPDFKIDLSGLKTSFAAQVGAAAEKRAASLPQCTSRAQITSFQDPFNATCLPPGLTPATAGANASSALLNGQGFLENPVITADNVKSSNSSPLFTTKLKSVPQNYRRAKATPIILSLLTLLLIAAIISLSSSRQRGLRRVGITLLAVGIFMLAFSWGLNYAINRKALPNIKLDNAVLSSDVKLLVTDISQAIDKNYWIFGGAYAAAGVLAIATPIVMNRRTGKKQSSAASTPQNEEADKAEKQTKQGQKKPPTLVQ